MPKLGAVAFFLFVASCGSDDQGKTGSTPQAAEADGGEDGSDKAGSTSKGGGTGETKESAANAFLADVNPVLKKSCGDSFCHGKSSPFGAYVDDDAVFLANGSDVLQRLAMSGTGQMPPPGGKQTLSDADRQVIESFLVGQGISKPGSTGNGSTDDGDDTDDGNPQTPIVVGPQAKLCADVSASDKAAGLTMTFDEVNVAAVRSCGGGGCHIGAAPHGFTDHPETWNDKSYATGMLVDIKFGSMPKAGRTLSAADRAAIYSYVCARHDI